MYFGVSNRSQKWRLWEFDLCTAKKLPNYLVINIKVKLKKVYFNLPCLYQCVDRAVLQTPLSFMHSLIIAMTKIDTDTDTDTKCQKIPCRA